ncbi:MAG: serine/threonine-protein kinase [Planctomycetota bacterium]
MGDLDASGSESRDPLDLLAEQFLQRVRKGESITPEQFAALHPDHGAELRDLLDTLLLLEGAKRDRESSATGGRRLQLPKLERLGDYRIVREVGRGGMGVVFEAVQESLDRRVALKVLPQASLLSGNQLERFRREAQFAARLHHTHIVPVFDSGEADGLHFYAMQFIDGRSLDLVVKALRKEPVDPGSSVARDRCRLAARLGAEVADALHHAHQSGTLHRDVKPANLLLDGDDHVWVTDFGLAKALEHDGLTHTGDVLGTLQYMAPEQFSGQYDARSEVYALSVTLFELIALRPAFAAETRAELIDRIRSGRCDRLSRLVPTVPEDLETIVARGMAVDPSRRYATAAQFGSDLRAYLEDRPIDARRQSGVELLLAWCRRNRALASAAAIAVLATATAAVVGWSSYWTTKDALHKVTQSQQSAIRASERDRANLEDTLQVFEDVFDTIVGPDPLYALLEDADETGTTVTALRAPVDSNSLALLERMLDFYDKFAERNRDNVALRQQTARSYARVGTIQERLGAHDEAIAAYERAAALLREIGDPEQKSELAALLQELGQVHVRRGQPRLAAPCYSESLELLEKGAVDPSRNERWLSARAHYLLATVPGFREGRGDGMRRLGGGRPGPEDGSPGSRRGPGRERRPGRDADPQAQPPRNPMAEAFFVQLQQEARAHLVAAQQALKALIAEETQNAEYPFLLARCLLEQARHASRGEPSTSNTERTEAIALLRRLVEEHPQNDAYRFELCEAQLPPSRARGPAGPSLALLEQLTAEARILVEHQPMHPEFQALLARTLSLWGSRLHEHHAQQDPRAGLVQMEEALAVQRKLGNDRSPREPRFVFEEVATMRRMVRVLVDAGDLDAAKSTARQLMATLIEMQREGSGFGRMEERLGDLPQMLDRLGLGELMRELRDPERRRR